MTTDAAPPTDANRWRDHNDLTGAIRILGELAIAGCGSVVAVIVGHNVAIELYTQIVGGKLHCIAQPFYCDKQVSIGILLAQLLIGWLGSFSFLAVSAAGRLPARKAVLWAVPWSFVATALAAIATAETWPKGGKLDIYWVALGYVLAFLLLLLAIVGWRRLWVTTR